MRQNDQASEMDGVSAVKLGYPPNIPKQRNFGLKKKTRNLRGYTPYIAGV